MGICDFDGTLVMPDNVKLRIYDGTRKQIGEDIMLNQTKMESTGMIILFLR